MSFLIDFLKENHTQPSNDIYNQRWNEERVIVIDDSPEMMSFTADEFEEDDEEGDLLIQMTMEEDLMLVLARLIAFGGPRDVIDWYVTKLQREAEINMKERIQELLKK